MIDSPSSTVFQLQTDRLLLRHWRDADLGPFAALNADQRVAEHLPSTLNRAQSDGLAARIREGISTNGFGLWAVERRDIPANPFIGFVGLSIPTFEAHFNRERPCVEIGWRLSPEHWGIGLATEGARAALAYAFEELKFDSIVSFTVGENVTSRRVMEKLGMHRDPSEDFDHPRVPPGHRLERHVLYRLTRRRWKKGSQPPIKSGALHPSGPGPRPKG